jgi:tetrahydromethanopterin S-methyltransferase subunit F
MDLAIKRQTGEAATSVEDVESRSGDIRRKKVRRGV